jgi:hypothetical protein
MNQARRIQELEALSNRWEYNYRRAVKALVPSIDQEGIDTLVDTIKGSGVDEDDVDEDLSLQLEREVEELQAANAVLNARLDTTVAYVTYALDDLNIAVGRWIPRGAKIYIQGAIRTLNSVLNVHKRYQDH